MQKAKVELEKSKINIDKNKDNISNEITNIFLLLDEAESRIQSAKGTLKSAEASADNGIITQLELKDARIFNDQANLNYYKAAYDYLDAYFDWEKATGRVE